MVYSLPPSRCGALSMLFSWLCFDSFILHVWQEPRQLKYLRHRWVIKLAETWERCSEVFNILIAFLVNWKIRRSVLFNCSRHCEVVICLFCSYAAETVVFGDILCINSRDIIFLAWLQKKNNYNTTQSGNQVATQKTKLCCYHTYQIAQLIAPILAILASEWVLRFLSAMSSIGEYANGHVTNWKSVSIWYMENRVYM